MRKLVAGLIGVGLLMLAGEWLADAAINPWAHSLSGAGTLTGTWAGAFVDYDNVSKPVRLVLRRTMTPGGAYEDEGSRISGELLVNGGKTAYAVTGRPHGWRGQTFTLRFEVTEPKSPRGYVLAEAAGEWRDGKLTLRAKPAFYEADGGRFASGSRYPLLQRVAILTLVSE